MLRASLFVLHMNSKFQIFIYNNASSNNSNFNNEKIHYTPTLSMIPNFQDDYRILSLKFYTHYMLQD